MPFNFRGRLCFTEPLLAYILARLLAIVEAATFGINPTSTQITFGGTWEVIPQLESTDGTVAYSNMSGSTATLDFTGSAIAVYGALQPSVGEIISPVSSLFTVDGGHRAFYNNSHISEVAFAVPFYVSGSLDYGQHTLVIKNLGANLWLDSLVVTVPDTLSQATTMPTPSSQSRNVTNIPHLTPGIIAGTSIAAVVVLLAGLGLVLWFRRRKRGLPNDRLKPFGTDGETSGVISTTVDTRPPKKHQLPNATNSTMSTASPPSPQPRQASATLLTAIPRVDRPENDTAIRLALSNGAPVSPPYDAHRMLVPGPRRSEDGGIRLVVDTTLEERSNAGTLPPAYGEYPTQSVRPLQWYQKN
ncbi:hypothetical protein C8Q78DRAFT_990575 [Trametes maxima]|nr:hypothetical protein C8Q78DRAFT_990575 [Trametes maxima]